MCAVRSIRPRHRALACPAIYEIYVSPADLLPVSYTHLDVYKRQLNDSNLIYATFSQGFRRGGVNALPAAEPAEFYVTPPALQKLQPDTADNYELGIKGTVINRFRYSADIFDIQWHNVQEGVQLTPLVLPASLNVGDAFSRGFEGDLEALWTRHLETQFSYTYDQTKLTSLNPLDINESVPPPALGSPLPGTPLNSVALDIAITEIPLGDGQLRYDIGGHYQSSLVPALSGTVPTVAGYTMLQTRLSLARAHWLMSLYEMCIRDRLWRARCGQRACL